jgi:small-conductance mechanosensitive channel
MSALGIGLERIAWVASALSVGIGFGLQAVVQNFVSGLILLAERPVKVGDWVALAGVEGDIRRINVRATEIQMGDRSTVIVPNSEFITKIVRNVTLANPLGLVQIKLPMPLDTDAARVRDLVRAAFEAHEDVLESPAPSVALDGIDNGRLVFNATGYVNSPRLAYNVRSALLFEVLQQLREAGLALSSPPTMLMAPGLGLVAQAPVSSATGLEPAPQSVPPGMATALPPGGTAAEPSGQPPLTNR